MPNESLIHADIFFFISTIALVLISIGIIICLVYGVKILRNVRDITDMARSESENVVADVRELRGVLRSEGVKWRGIAQTVRAFFQTAAQRRFGKKKAE